MESIFEEDQQVAVEVGRHVTLVYYLRDSSYGQNRELRKCVILRCSDSEASMLEEDVYELGRDNTKPLSMERSPGRTATQNLAQTRKGKKTAGKDFEIFRESA